MSTTIHQAAVRDARSLLTGDDFADVRATLMDSNPDMATSLASRIVTQALAFVGTAARFPTADIAPSPVVDEGWHALILHTALYAELCDRLGKFVDHYPQRPEPSGYSPDRIAHTLAKITEAGYAVDVELWRGPGDNRITVGARTWHTPPGGCGPITPMPRPKPPAGG
ncbi:hypothetical protein HY68_07250 [Streptomyces sp. AcH 505]|uniref:glycine-rich domain-containing protein n=1 Tax=Streptomyces sp. AcH 505 TaxID=352211 RepID=UPI00059186B5|nr:hypothetical protein HY68_07250 [Streptomyces sp. AcH 505]